MYHSNRPTHDELPSTMQLLRSTLIAAIVALALLVSTVLPAEYGIDPSGIGSLLGLKKMGEIKVSLEQEATIDRAVVPQKIKPVADVPTLDEATITTATKPNSQVSQIAQAASHQKSISLQPGEAAEIKLKMKQGAKVTYQWTTVGGLVNYDTHGDSSTLDYFGYGKGRQVKEDKGELIAEFDGEHGWFWRNRSSNLVTILLSTQGNYQAIQRKL